MSTIEEHYELADAVMAVLEEKAPAVAEHVRNAYECGEPESVWAAGLQVLVDHKVVLNDHLLGLLREAVKDVPELENVEGNAVVLQTFASHAAA